ncbi:hypothetical protein [Streptococcus hyointestinalis]|uniref:hypothetical protein n=1 Tax=Streptococcus hyointestinalis TaxID=1337 RepID=UPI003D06DC7D
MNKGINDSERTLLKNYDSQNKTFQPIKTIIQKEVDSIILELNQIDEFLAFRLNYVFDIMLRNFHEDILATTRREMNWWHYAETGAIACVERARLMLLKDGYPDDKAIGSPTGELAVALSEINRLQEREG